MPTVAQGGTLRLSALYHTADGGLTDPTSPYVDIINPSSTVVVDNASVVRDSVGEYHYDFTTDNAAPLGTWTARFYGTVSGGLLSADQPFDVVAPGSIDWSSSVISLNEARAFFNKDVDDTSDDGRYATLIPAVSAAIRNHTDRDFGTALVTETREFDYDGSGFIDIDDASEITAVSWKIPNSDPLALTSDAWRAGPSRRDDAPVFFWIEVPAYIGVAGGSPAMGFTSNLDVYSAEHGTQGVPCVAIVTGTFGWPIIPPDVKMAAFWTLQDWLSKPSGDQLTAEAIASYSRSFGNRVSQGPANAIPAKAQDLLAQYTKHLV